MRVAVLAHLHHPVAEPFAGGMETHTAMVCDELILRGHEVTLFAKRGSSTLGEVEPVLDTDLDHRRFRSARGWQKRDRVLDTGMRRALNRIDRGDFDLVFNNSLSPLPYTELTDRPVLTVLHTPPTLEKVNLVIDDPGWRPGSRHAFVGVSQYNSESWRAKLPSVTCIPNGIYRHQWPESRRAEPDLAVWSARITPEKGLHLAIDAAAHAGMRLEFGGPVADRSYFDSVIAPRLSERVVYRGHLNHQQLSTLLGRGRVFLSTALWAEPFGLALVEAMTCGTPVAALPNGAAHEVVGPDGGVVSSACSAEALGHAMRAARSLDRRKVALSTRRYSSEAMMDGYENLMHHLLHRDLLPTLGA